MGFLIAYLILIILYFMPIYKILRASYLNKKDKVFMLLLVVLSFVVSSITTIITHMSFIRANNEEKIQMLASGQLSHAGQIIMMFGPLVVFIYAKYFYKSKNKT